MDLTSVSTDWISQFVTDDYGHGWAQPEIPSFSTVFESSDSGDCRERAAKQAKRSDPKSSLSSSADLFPGGAVISFGSPSSPSSFHHNQELPQHEIKPKLEALAPGEEYGLVAGSCVSGNRRAGVATPVVAVGGREAREHVIAERKRREKLTQRFILLSSLLPGLKKLDKASVLGEAARYLKQLQEQVKALEGQATQTAAESPVVVTNLREDRISSADSYGSSSSGEASLPEIQARISDKDVLVNVQCQSRQGVVQKILEEIQRLHLTLVNCSAMPFGKHAMAVTVVAKMNDEYSASTTVELISLIRQRLQTLM